MIPKSKSKSISVLTSLRSNAMKKTYTIRATMVVKKDYKVVAESEEQALELLTESGIVNPRSEDREEDYNEELDVIDSDDNCFAMADFGQLVIEEMDGWEYLTPGNEWNRYVYVSSGGDKPTTRVRFKVVFEPDSEWIIDHEIIR
jgi:hypothetical protein